MAKTKKVYSINKNQDITDYPNFVKKVDGVIVRLGYRGSSTGNLSLDPKFEVHVRNLIRTGVPIGVSFFTNAIDNNEAKEEAKFIVDTIVKANVTLQFPIFINSDYALLSHDGRADCLTKEKRTSILLTIIRSLKELGFKSAIYATETWFNSMLDLNQTRDIDKLCIKTSGTTKPKVNENLIGWEYDIISVPENTMKPFRVIKYYADINEQAAEIPVEEVVEEPEESVEEDSNYVELTMRDLIKIPGTAIELEEVELFATSVVSTPISVISGTYYTWDGRVIRDRIRITDSLDKVGKADKYIGWVDVDDFINDEE